MSVTNYLKVLMTGGLPELPRDVLAEGLAAYAAGNLAAAAEDLTAALQANPTHLQARQTMARIAMAQRDFKTAEAQARQAAAHHETDAASHTLLGEILHAQKDYMRAEKCYRNAIEVNDKYTDGYIRLGVLQFETRRLQEALATLNQAIYLDRKAAVARFYVAQICLEFEDFQRALVQLYLVDKIQPGFAPVYQTLATIFEHIGDTRQAIIEFEKLIDLGAADANIFFRLGLAHLKLRAKDLALPAFQRATELEPRHWEAHFHTAQLLEEQKRYTQALEHYRALLQSKAYADLARLSTIRIQKLLAQIAKEMAG